MALEDAPVVNILPFDEKEAYNHDRPISSLIRTQLLHLHTAENLVLPPEKRTNTNINHLLTERQASEYIQKVTALLHEHGKAQQHKAARGKSKPAKKKSRTSGGGNKKSFPRKAAKSRSVAKKRTSRKSRR